MLCGLKQGLVALNALRESGDLLTLRQAEEAAVKESCCKRFMELVEKRTGGIKALGKALSAVGQNRCIKMPMGVEVRGTDGLFGMEHRRRQALWIPNGKKPMKKGLLVCAPMKEPGNRGRMRPSSGYGDILCGQF